ncbi:MAG: IS481 family transposase, partial [Peptoniphilaceae bacterium]|nr:IS481 family transposase [Peptoniphilaceae bacterium]
MTTSITKTQRYLPHTLETRFHAVKTYRAGDSLTFVLRRYKISKASLMRWNQRFDGTKDSLRDRSHKPKSPHPNAHTPQEQAWIRNLLRRNPGISLMELY